MRRIALVSALLALLLSAAPVAAAHETRGFTVSETPIVLTFSTSQTGFVSATAILREGAGVEMTLTGPTVCERRRCDKHHPPETYVCSVVVTELTYPYTGKGCGFYNGPAGDWTISFHSLSGYSSGWIDWDADYLVPDSCPLC